MVKHIRWKGFFTPQRLAILILMAHLALGVLYSVAIPIWEAHDEWGHYAFVHYLATEQAFPPPGTKLVERYDESHQPPLYYILGALATFWINTDDGLELTTNPYATTGDGTGGVNFAVHHWEAESFPYRDTVLGIHVTRLVSVLLSTLVVWTTYLIGRSLFPERGEIALGAMAINAFWPQFLFIGSVVNNDIMVTTFASLVLWLTLRIVIQKAGFKDWLALGLCLAGALASKGNAFALFPLVLLGLTVLAIRWMKKKSAPIRWGIVALSGVGLVLAWWLFQNMILFLSRSRFRTYARLSQIRDFLDPSAIAERLNWRSFLDTLQYAFITLWAAFGWGNIGVEEWIYDLVALIFFLAGLGLLFFLSKKSRSQVRLGLVILIADVLFVTALPVYISMYRGRIFLMPGRYILPAISAVSVLLSVGLAGPVPARVARTVMAIVTALMFAFTLLVPFRYILPAYTPPPLLSQADVQAIQNPLHVNFNKAELLGYDVGKGRVRAGEAIAITLYWRCLNPMEHNYTLAVQVLGPDFQAHGGVNLYPGRGNFATSLWEVGDTFSETYWIPVDPDVSAPVMGRIKVALFIDDSTQEHLPVLNPQGQVADRSAVFGRIKIVPRKRPEHVIENQVHYELDGKVALIGYELTSPIDRETALGLSLYWQALSDLDEDYTVFVHWLDEGGQILTQQDNQPRNGTYPTGLWEEGEIVEDLYHLTIPAEVSVDQQPVIIALGMYCLGTMERLAISDENGQHLADDQIILRDVVSAGDI